MIRLSADALADGLCDHLADGYKPTHAMAVSHSISYATNPEINVTYWLGQLDADGNFVPNQHVPIVAFQIPNAMQRMVADATDIDRIMKNLLGEGVAPHPKDPRDTMEVPGKAARDWKAQDVDAVAAWVHPRLRGEVV